MISLVLRPSGRREADKAWSLQLRFAHCGGTEYSTVAHVSREEAEEIVRAGAPYWLFGDPPDGPPPVEQAEFSVVARAGRMRSLLGERAELRAQQDQARALSDAADARVQRMLAVDAELDSLRRLGS